jgi:hypothetical protein
VAIPLILPAAGFKAKPSWFLVSEDDNAISRDAERFVAQRMDATSAAW